MAYINLLPWREEAQKAKQREFFSLLALVALSGIAIILAVSQFYSASISNQEKRNQFLTNEITILDSRIAEIKELNAKKAELEKRIRVVEQLQRSRNVGTQVLNEIAKIVPTGVYLISIEKEENTLQIIGKSESNNHLANMIREIDRSELFADPSMETITSDENNSRLLSEFRMRVRIRGLVGNLNDAVNSVSQGGR
ncbi:PilN domain-containing protein [Thalassotalea agarivorans]|uniref:Type IV pilus assembly protein PilN n=1 Tax=Thalassotalea agarivorans TaxID=349064 RepID=A0A1I0CF49_THASX|nr:PilN domain-containing protein [Thalassotalea agarivorans]SET18225.1 type IV pilus assembly protein PilN [Thalassotalea agarivorans]